MNSWKKKLALAGGYASFFVACLMVFLYLTFDPQFMVPLAQDQARKNRLNLSIQKLSLHRLFGLEIRGISISPLPRNSGEAPPPLTIDRLVLSPSISALPSLLSSLGSGQNPPLDLDYKAWIGPGKIQGSIIQVPPSLEFSTLITKVPLERLPLPAFFIQGMQVSGDMSARINLDLKDQMRPDTWSGEVQADLDNPRISDFNYTGIQVAGVSMEKATMKAEMKEGNVTINAIKFMGQDVPMNLQGSISFKRPIGRSIVELKGTLEIGDAYKEKMPIISGLLPADGQYSFRGTLDNMIPGI